MTIIVSVVLVALLLWPVLIILGFDGMGMLESYGNTGYGWIGLALLLLAIEEGYVFVRRLLNEREAHGPALEELRRVYARDELTDEEFETHRTKLRSEKWGLRNDSSETGRRPPS